MILFQSLRKADQGSTAIFFGLIAAVLFGVVGLAVDTGRAYSAKAKLQATADAAALAAATAYKVDQDTAEDTAQSFIAANLDDDPSIVHAEHTIALNDTQTEVQVTSTADIKTSFLQMFGVSHMKAEATSVATLGANYLDIYLILDVSESMDRAATAADVARLKALTKPFTDARPETWEYTEQGCAFACHGRSRNGWEPPGKTVYQIARENNVLLRTDVLLSSSKALVREVLSAQSPSISRDRIRIGVLAFDEQAKRIGEPSADLATVEQMLDQAVDTTQPLETRYDDTMSQLASWVGSSGDGLSRDTAKKIAVIVTDGVESGIMHDVISSDNCNLFKNNGVNLGVVEVKYLEDPVSPNYIWRVEPIYQQITPALQACASSPSMFFHGDDPHEIETAFRELAKSVTERIAALTR